MSDSCQPGKPGAYPTDCEILESYRTRVREKNQMKPQLDPVLAEKAKHIKVLLLDVDGVLTDGTLLYSSTGEEFKAFNTLDGFGITLLNESGIATGIITARESAMVSRRAKELKMAHVCQGARNKSEPFRRILKEHGLKPFEIAYMGDDWLDLPLLTKVGLAIAPANGADEVKERVHYVTPRAGGHGAVRDACNLILEAQGKLDQLLEDYCRR